MKNIFSIYKQKGITSHDVVNKVRKVTGEKRVGHGGTLDPLATGVLVIAVGRESTKQLSEVVKKEKEYLAEITLGKNSTTYDEEGEKTIIDVKKIPSAEEIKKVVNHFIGKINQVPPIYSAIKINGQSAYKKARKGKGSELEMKARVVEVKEIEVLDYKFPLLKIRVVTGPGVYIRSLAYDIGKSLKVGGYMSGLERIRVGDFKKDDCVEISKIVLQ